MADPARSLVTVDVLDTLPDEQRAEVIDGELVYEAITSFDHGDAQLSLGAALKSRFGGGGPDGKSGWWLASEVTVIYAADQGFRHDVVGWKKSRVPVRPKGRRVTIRPDWVCEILSTNKRKDLVVKRRILHDMGVPQLDPRSRGQDTSGPTLAHRRLSPRRGSLARRRRRARAVRAVELEVTTLFGDLEQDETETER